jgi:DNA-nicking Smr family endonuclease
MARPRALTIEERAQWRRVAATVSPLAGRRVPEHEPVPPAKISEPASKVVKRPGSPPQAAPPKPAAQPLDAPVGLDAGWERRLGKGLVAPDFTLDLHGLGLEAAHARLEHGIALALAQQARLVLVIAGRPRPATSADRAHQRGAIRAKLLDWLAHGAHAGRIAAVRPAHRRHGGAGAVYVVLRRPR